MTTRWKWLTTAVVAAGLAFAGPAVAAPWDTGTTTMPTSHPSRACAVRMLAVQVSFMQGNGWRVVMLDLYTFDTQPSESMVGGTIMQMDGQPVAVAAITIRWNGRWVVVLSPTTERGLCRYRAILRKPWIWDSEADDAIDTGFHEVLHQLWNDGADSGHAMVVPRAMAMQRRFERMRQRLQLRG